MAAFLLCNQPAGVDTLEPTFIVARQAMIHEGRRSFHDTCGRFRFVRFEHPQVARLG